MLLWFLLFSCTELLPPKRPPLVFHLLCLHVLVLITYKKQHQLSKVEDIKKWIPDIKREMEYTIQVGCAKKL